MSYEAEPVGAFLAAVASERVSPAGGTAAAVVGATGAALCEMCCTHTLNKREDDALAARRDDLERLRGQLLSLADADAAAVETLFGADDPERADQTRVVGVPLTIAEACADVVEEGATATADGTQSAVPDAATGVLLAYAALRAAAFAVRYNTKDDASEFSRKARHRVDRAEERGDVALEAVGERIDAW